MLHLYEVDAIYTYDVLGACFVVDTSLYIAEHRNGHGITIFKWNSTLPARTLNILKEFDSIEHFEEYIENLYSDDIWMGRGSRYGDVAFVYYVAENFGAFSFLIEDFSNDIMAGQPAFS